MQAVICVFNISILHLATCRKFLRREKVKNFKLKELKLIIVIISNPCLKNQTHSFNKMEQIRGALATKLQGIERYNPENITLLESYVDAQVRENGYDLEANLALLKLYQFNSGLFNANAVFMIMVRIKFIRSCDISRPLR